LGFELILLFFDALIRYSPDWINSQFLLPLRLLFPKLDFRFITIFFIAQMVYQARIFELRIELLSEG